MQINEMTIGETRKLVHWCGTTTEDLWKGLTLTGIVAVYNASGTYDTASDWLTDDPDGAATILGLVRALS